MINVAGVPPSCGERNSRVALTVSDGDVMEAEHAKKSRFPTMHHAEVSATGKLISASSLSGETQLCQATLRRTKGFHAALK